MTKRLKLYEVHSFSTSPNSCHHTTVLNADVPNCYIEHATPSLSWSKRRPTSYLRHCGRRSGQIWTRSTTASGVFCRRKSTTPKLRTSMNSKHVWFDVGQTDAVWPVDRWRRYQPVASSSKRLCPCTRGTLRAQILTILKRAVNCIILLNKP